MNFATAHEADVHGRGGPRTEISATGLTRSSGGNLCFGETLFVTSTHSTIASSEIRA